MVTQTPGSEKHALKVGPLLKPESLTCHIQVIFWCKFQPQCVYPIAFLILMFSQYGLSFSSSSSGTKHAQRNLSSLWYMLSETAKEVFKRGHHKRHLVAIFFALSVHIGLSLKVIAKFSNAEFQPGIYIMDLT